MRENRFTGAFAGGAPLRSSGSSFSRHPYNSRRLMPSSGQATADQTETIAAGRRLPTGIISRWMTEQRFVNVLATRFEIVGPMSWHQVGHNREGRFRSS